MNAYLRRLVNLLPLGGVFGILGWQAIHGLEYIQAIDRPAADFQPASASEIGSQLSQGFAGLGSFCNSQMIALKQMDRLRQQGDLETLKLKATKLSIALGFGTLDAGLAYLDAAMVGSGLSAIGSTLKSFISKQSGKSIGQIIKSGLSASKSAIAKSLVNLRSGASALKRGNSRILKDIVINSGAYTKRYKYAYMISRMVQSYDM